MTNVKYTYSENDAVRNKVNVATGLTPTTEVAANYKTQEMNFAAQLSPSDKANLDKFMNTEGFIFSSQVPRIDSITPAWGDSDDVVNITNLAGEGFTGATAVKLKKAGKPDIVASAVVVVTDVKITCTFDLTGADSGAWDVEVTCLGGTKVTLLGGFVISGCITAITPNSGHDLVSITNLAGVGLTGATDVRLIHAGQPDIVATNLVVVSDTKITCDLDLTGALLDAWDVQVTLADSTTDTLVGGFTIIGIDSITPNTGHNDNPALSITNLHGLGLTGATDARLKLSGQPDIVGSTFTVASDTKITCDFDLTGALTGVWDVEVTLADTTKVTLPAAFTVIGIDDIAPVYGVGEGTQDVTIGGKGFTGATTAKLKKLGETPIVASVFVVTDDNEIACNFNLEEVALGNWDVEVTLVDASTVTLPAAFGVLGQVTSIAPNTGHNDTSVNITDLEGCEFTGATNVQLTRAGHTTIDCSALVVVDDDKITCTFDLTGAATGAWNVVVTLRDSSAVALPVGFVIKGIDSITPNTGNNTGPVDITDLLGKGFTGATAVKLKKGGESDIVGSSLDVVDDNNITCTFDITGATTGAWDVEVTLADTTKVTLAGGFTVYHSA